MTAPFATRRAAARARMREAGVSVLLLGPGADLRYLTGYDALPLERLTMLVLGLDAEELLVVPELEAPRARSQGVDVPLHGWPETADPFGLVVGAVGSPEGTIAVSDRLWASSLLRLQHDLTGVRFGKASEVVAPLRAVKDADEIEALATAARIADGVAELLAGERVGGRSERELSRWLTERLMVGGCQRVNFAIVAAGENAASPHHEPTDRPIHDGDALVCDFGGIVEGYCSDITRTFVVGSASDELTRVHAVVRRAQQAGLDAAVAGKTCGSADAAARGVIEAAGYGEAFIHRLGHGIGLEEHEEPYLVDGNDTVIEDGMAFSIEPGVYLAGSLGVRIEDIAVVRDGRAQRLNVAPHDLIALKP